MLRKVERQLELRERKARQRNIIIKGMEIREGEKRSSGGGIERDWSGSRGRGGEQNRKGNEGRGGDVIS